MKQMIKFTIITVCFQAAAVIEKTIRSVLEQTYANIEYILVDGASTDGTLEIIKKYAQTDSRVRFISEPDKGIYDAMNKGIDMATGDYINMMNAGDYLKGRKTLEKLNAFIETHTGDIFYGNIIYDYPDNTNSTRVYSKFCGTKFYYLLGDCINHQSIFARKECFSHDNFDLSYKISADRDWMIRMHKAGKKYVPTGITICHYSLDEASASVEHESLAWDENRAQIKKYFKAGYPVYWTLDKIRHGKVSSKILHKAYEIVFLRKKDEDRNKGNT
ncbi:MAG: glycosyltransferase [Lachnospiraceae bacterium]|nr:glycosyltransferase [Candidatus Merdinaster equi]